MKSKEFNRAIGAVVRQMRISRGLSQSKVGEAIGVTYQQAQKSEAGINAFSAYQLHVLAGFFGVHVAELYEKATAAFVPGNTVEPAEPPTRMHLEAMRAFSRLPERLQRSTLNFVKALAAEKAA